MLCFAWWWVVSSCTLSETLPHILHLYFLGVDFFLRVWLVIMMVPFLGVDELVLSTVAFDVSTDTSDLSSVSPS